MTEDVFVFPLSFAQQRLAFLDQLAPGNPFYNVPSVVRLTGPLNVAALEQVFHEVVRRHESLRTTFSTEDGSATQVVAATVDVEIPVVDASPLCDRERETTARRLSGVASQRPFDLECGPLLRVRLLRLAEREHVLILVMHHIISDAWSMDVLVRELFTLYEAYSQGQPSRLPDLSIQYPDYAVWQRERFEAGELAGQLAYWKDQLQGAPAVARVTDRSVETAGPEVLRRKPILRLARASLGGSQDPRPAARRHAVHDLVGGISGAVEPLFGPARYPRWYSDRWSQPQ